MNAHFKNHLRKIKTINKNVLRINFENSHKYSLETQTYSADLELRDFDVKYSPKGRTR
jgi:hypothetical protein